MTPSDSPIDVSRETSEKLRLFAELLERWNRRINLISARDMPMLWPRHIADSLQLAPHCPADARQGLDMGSGAGFPGLIVCLATGIPFDLVEADQRKAAFLREAVRITEAPARVRAMRVEDLERNRADLVTARALAPLPDLLTMASSVAKPGATYLFLKGRTAQGELTAAGQEWHISVRRHPSVSSPDSSLLVIRDALRRT